MAAMVEELLCGQLRRVELVPGGQEELTDIVSERQVAGPQETNQPVRIAIYPHAGQKFSNNSTARPTIIRPVATAKMR